MVRNIEKLIKIECPKEISERKIEAVKAFPTLPTLDLTNLEPYTEPGITVHVDLGLDQLEEED